MASVSTRFYKFFFSDILQYSAQSPFSGLWNRQQSKNQTVLRDLVHLSTHRDPLEISYLIVTYGFALELTNSCLN